MKTRPPYRHTFQCHRAFALACTVAGMLLLSGCVSTPQPEMEGQSVPGRPTQGGAGGSGGGGGAGTALGTASGGAGGGVSTAPSALPPESVGTPSMSQDGSKPNPAPTATARSATGFTLTESGTAPASGPESNGTTGESIDNDGDATGTGAVANADANGRGSSNTVALARDAAAATGTESAQPVANAEASNEPEQNAGEITGDGSDEISVTPERGADNAVQANGELAGGSDDAGQQARAAAIGTIDVTDRDGPATLAERRAEIRGRLDASYAVIDGLTLAERERVQRAANPGGIATGTPAGTGAESVDNKQDGGGADGMAESSVAIAANSSGTGGATRPAETTGRLGYFANQNADVTYPIPIDIPSGEDDDTVARQLREAAMREANPELREKLWNEYRRYVGLIEQ